MLLGDEAQGPSLSLEPLLGRVLALTLGLTCGQRPPSSHPTQPCRSLPSILWIPVGTEMVKAKGIHTG